MSSELGAIQSRSLSKKYENGHKLAFDDESIASSLYRPFSKTHFYFNRDVNEYVYKMPQFFPEKNSENLVFSTTGRGATKGFSVLISNCLFDYETISKGQCFPLYLYEKTQPEEGLFAQASEETGYKRHNAISDDAFKHFTEAYPNLGISKEDIFYYIYGLLHSEEYRERYADNLSKQLPRIPRVKTESDFTAYSQAGRDLAQLHLNYEEIPLYTGVKLTGSLKGLTAQEQQVAGGSDDDFRVTKMKFLKKKDPETGKNVNDKTRVAYNGGITIENIPEEAYDYVVNGKPALEWVMERQSVTTHKASGITNDANDWAIETMENAKYPLELFLRVITVSLETQKIVNSLPKLELLQQ